MDADRWDERYAAKDLLWAPAPTADRPLLLYLEEYGDGYYASLGRTPRRGLGSRP